jgi:hypothetical protein
MTSVNALRTALVAVAVGGAALLGTQAAHPGDTPARRTTRTQAAAQHDDTGPAAPIPTPSPTTGEDNNPWD